MVSRTRFQAVVTGLVLYALAALLITYFWTNAYAGKYGLKAQAELDQESVQLTSELRHLRSERQAWERRTNSLRAHSIDPDMLDERAREQLNFVHERDLVLLLRESQQR